MVVLHERVALNERDVRVVAHDSGHAGLANLVKLRDGEALLRIVTVLVVESVAKLQVSELLGDDALNESANEQVDGIGLASPVDSGTLTGKGGAYESVRNGVLAHSAHEEVNVVNVFVQTFQLLSLILGHVVQVVERFGQVETAQLPVLVVGLDAMVTASVDVQGCQGEAVGWRIAGLFLEQMVIQRVRDVRVERAGSVDGHSSHESIDTAFLEGVSRVQYYVGQ